MTIISSLLLNNWNELEANKNSELLVILSVLLMLGAGDSRKISSLELNSTLLETISILDGLTELERGKLNRASVARGSSALLLLLEGSSMLREGDSNKISLLVNGCKKSEVGDSNNSLVLNGSIMLI